MMISSQALGGLSGAGIEVRPSAEIPSLIKIHIPKDLASIEEVYQAPAKLDPRLIIHIQNAHGNYDAQVKIKNLIDYLVKNYGFKLMFVEGVADSMNADWLRLFKDPKKNEEMMDYLAKKGQATGADLYLMEHPEGAEGVGIEEVALYRANYDAFVKVYLGEGESKLFLDQFEGKLDLLASRYLNSEVRKMLSEWKKFNLGHREFLPYLQKLSKEAKRILGLDLESLFSQVEWPQITRLLVMQSMEADLNRDQAVAEKAKLLQFLKEKQVSPSVIEGIENLEDNSISMWRVSSDNSDPDRAPRHLLEELVDVAGPMGFQFSDYPAFSLYAGYLIIQSEIETRNLFEEIERLFDKILDELAVTEEEKDLLELYRDVELMKKLLSLELNRKEWKRTNYRLDWIRPDAMIKRLESLYERVFKIGSHQFPSSIDTKDLKIPENFSETFESALLFYEFARQRESAFYFKIKKEMNSRDVNKAILVTGGFHTDGLSDLFRDDQISYGVVIPNIANLGDKAGYVSTMLQDHKTMFDVAQLEIPLPSQSLEDLRNEGVDIASFKEIK